jgi:hypothetical protein
MVLLEVRSNAMSDYKKVSPHYDRPLTGTAVAGMRPGWLKSLIISCPKSGPAREGYLAALYCLKANEMPGAYLRQADVWRIQEAIGEAIRILTE